MSGPGNPKGAEELRKGIHAAGGELDIFLGDDSCNGNGARGVEAKNENRGEENGEGIVALGVEYIFCVNRGHLHPSKSEEEANEENIIVQMGE